MPTNQGKTIETALHHVITNIQEAVENREVTLGAFLHIKGAFDGTSFDITERLSNGMGSSILGGTNITAVFAGENPYRSVASHCLQAGI